MLKRIIYVVVCMSFCVSATLSHGQSTAPESKKTPQQLEDHAREVDKILDQSVSASDDQNILQLKGLLDKAINGEEKEFVMNDKEKTRFISHENDLKAALDAWNLTRDKLQDSELATAYWAKLMHKNPALPLRLVDNVSDREKRSALVFVNSLRDYHTSAYGFDVEGMGFSSSEQYKQLLHKYEDLKDKVKALPGDPIPRYSPDDK